MAQRVPPIPLAADAFAALAPTQLANALESVNALVGMEPKSSFAESFFSSLSAAERDRVNTALASYELCNKLRKQLKLTKIAWLRDAATVAIAEVRRVRKADADLQRLEARVLEISTHEQQHWVEALSLFDRYFVTLSAAEMAAVGADGSPAHDYQALRIEAVTRTQWWRNFVGDQAPDRYIALAVVVLLPALSMALWRHVFDDHLGSVVAKAQEGWTALSGLAVGLGVPLGGMAKLRGPILALLRRPLMGGVLVLMSLVASGLMVRASLKMQELRFRCHALGLETARIQSSVNGTRRALCTEDPMWIDPDATVRFWAPRFREVHKPLAQLRPVDGTVTITLQVDARFVHLTRESQASDSTGHTTWRVLFDNGGLSSVPVKLTVELTHAASGVGLQISTPSTSSDDCGAAPSSDNTAREARSTQTLVFGPSCFANQTSREFLLWSTNATENTAVAPLSFAVEHELVPTR